MVHIENGKNPLYLETIKNMIEKSANDSSKYFEAYSQLLFMEQAVAVMSLQQYNCYSVQIIFDGIENSFKIKNDVRISLKIQ